MHNAADEFWQATIAAALLRQGRWPGTLSVGLSVIAVAALLLAIVCGQPVPAILAILSLVAGGVALWLSMRAGLDAALFVALAKDCDLAAFDAGMLSLGLMSQAQRGRPLGARIAGALGLLKRQLLALAAQFALLLAGSLLVHGWTAW